MQNATTKEQAHTAGPWLYRPDKYDDWGFVRAQPEQGRLLGGVICQARDPYALDDVTLNAHRRAKTDPWEANARLIAAAPDLLEALQLVWDTYGMDPSVDSSIWQTARAAIAKATGGQSCAPHHWPPKPHTSNT